MLDPEHNNKSVHLLEVATHNNNEQNSTNNNNPNTNTLHSLYSSSFPKFIEDQRSFIDKYALLRICLCCFRSFDTSHVSKEHIYQYYHWRHIASEPYDDNNPVHEDQLKRLFLISFPTAQMPSSLITSEWKKIGFQGENPRTDFRGAGFFSVKFLIYFIENFKEDFIFLNEFEFFLFAVVCINLCVNIFI